MSQRWTAKTHLSLESGSEKTDGDNPEGKSANPKKFNDAIDCMSRAQGELGMALWFLRKVGNADRARSALAAAITGVDSLTM